MIIFSARWPIARRVSRLTKAASADPRKPVHAKPYQPLPWLLTLQFACKRYFCTLVLLSTLEVLWERLDSVRWLVKGAAAFPCELSV